MMKAIGKWIWNVLISVDQLGNAVAGGDPDITISARVGFFANKSEDRSFYYYWRFLEIIINFTFYPLDGENHCLLAYEDDKQNGHQQGSDLMKAVLGLIAVTACSVIAMLTWTAYVFGLRPNGRLGL